MKRAFIEKRIIKAIRGLHERRIEIEGTEVTHDEIASLKVRTFSPFLQSVYCILGTLLFVLGMWIQFRVGNMAVAMGLVFIGFLNIAFGVNGRPRAISDLNGVDIEALSQEAINPSRNGNDK